MTKICNDKELMAVLMNDFTEIINVVADRVLEEIVKPSIQENVYDVGNPTTYDRQGETGGLLGAWEKNDPSVTGNIINSEIAVNPLSMTLDNENFIHGSQYWAMNDVRSILAGIINDGESGNLFGNGWWRTPRNFWSPIEIAVKNGSINKIIEDEMTKRGINWVKI